jgi:hypothetical protein
MKRGQATDRPNRRREQPRFRESSQQRRFLVGWTVVGGGFGFLVIVFAAGGPVGFFVGKAFGVGVDPAGGLTRQAG